MIQWTFAHLLSVNCYFAQMGKLYPLSIYHTIRPTEHTSTCVLLQLSSTCTDVVQYECGSNLKFCRQQICSNIHIHTSILAVRSGNIEGNPSLIMKNQREFCQKSSRQFKIYVVKIIPFLIAIFCSSYQQKALARKTIVLVFQSQWPLKLENEKQYVCFNTMKNHIISYIAQPKAKKMCHFLLPK